MDESSSISKMKSGASGTAGTASETPASSLARASNPSQAAEQPVKSSFWSIAGSSSLWDDDEETLESIIGSDVTLLGGLVGRDNLTSALEDVVGTFLRRGILVGAGIWLFLLAVMVLACPADSYQRLTGKEQVATAVLLTILVGVNFNRLGPLFVNDRNWLFLKSGAMATNVCVQCIAIVSASAMMFLPTPVLIDPTTGLRFHMVRWAQWVALTFLMTFLSEGIDLPLENSSADGADKNDNSKASWTVATVLTFSTLSGFLFPFCPNATWWIITMVIAWILILILPMRLIQKRNRLRNMKKGFTTMEKENYERAKFSVKLLKICTVLWGLLALVFTVCCIAVVIAPADSVWADESLILIAENAFEVLSKVGYLSILMEIHQQLFDDVAKTARRLQELCAYMSALWDVSSDVVIICSKNDHLVNAAVSPAFFQLGQASGSSRISSDHPITLVMEVDPYEGTYNTSEIDLTKPMSRAQAHSLLENLSKPRTVTPVFQKNLKVLADLVGDACAYAIPGGTNRQVLAKDFYCIDEENKCMRHNLSKEANIFNLRGKAILIVLKDMTDRIKLVKAESRLRKFDSPIIPEKQGGFETETVKNGLSAAIELLDSLQQKDSKKGDKSEGLEKLGHLLRTILSSGETEDHEKTL